MDEFADIDRLIELACEVEKTAKAAVETLRRKRTRRAKARGLTETDLAVWQVQWLLSTRVMKDTKDISGYVTVFSMGTLLVAPVGCWWALFENGFRVNIFFSLDAALLYMVRLWPFTEQHKSMKLIRDSEKSEPTDGHSH
jgi:hypothetical protein